MHYPAGTSLQTCTNIRTSPDVLMKLQPFNPQNPAHTQIHCPANKAPANPLPANYPDYQKHNFLHCYKDNLLGAPPIWPARDFDESTTLIRPLQLPLHTGLSTVIFKGLADWAHSTIEKILHHNRRIVCFFILFKLLIQRTKGCLVVHSSYFLTKRSLSRHKAMVSPTFALRMVSKSIKCS